MKRRVASLHRAAESFCSQKMKHPAYQVPKSSKARNRCTVEIESTRWTKRRNHMAGELNFNILDQGSRWWPPPSPGGRCRRRKMRRSCRSLRSGWFTVPSLHRRPTNPPRCPRSPWPSRGLRPVAEAAGAVNTQLRELCKDQPLAPPLTRDAKRPSLAYLLHPLTFREHKFSET